MHKTQFAGLTAPDADDAALSVDGGSFATRNPDLTDHFLAIGAVTHRHDAHPALGTPQMPASATVLGSGGTIPSDQEINIGWTVTDRWGGETRMAPGITVSTQPSIQAPSGEVAADFDSTGGVMPVGDYGYAITIMDAGGGETTEGVTTIVNRPPGFASGQVQLSGLAAELTPGDRWRLWRSDNGGPLDLIAVGTDDTFTDYGIDPVDHAATPPLDSTKTNSTNEVVVTLPMASGASGDAVVADPNAVEINLYVSVDGSFISPSLYEVYPVASAGQDVTITALVVQDGSPPEVATSIPGANQIDPDTELLDMHWKRPVANAGALPTGSATTEGDVRITLDDGTAHRFHASAWGPLGGASGGSGGSGQGSPYRLGGWDGSNVTDAEWVEWRPVGAGSADVSPVAVVGYTNEVADNRFTEEWLGASGAVAGGYQRNGSGFLIPSPTNVGSECFNYAGYPNAIGDGQINREIEINDPSHITYTGIHLGQGFNGVYALYYPDGMMRIYTRVGGALGTPFTLVAEVQGPVPASGATYYLGLIRRGLHYTFEIYDPSTKTTYDLDGGDIGSYSDPTLYGDYGAVTDRYSNVDAWQSDYVTGDQFVEHYHLRARVGVGTEFDLINDDGTIHIPAPVMAPVNGISTGFGAGWGHPAASGYVRAVQDTLGVYWFAGRPQKTTGSAAVAGEVICNIGAYGVADPSTGTFWAPGYTKDFPVVTGDDDGTQLGMVRVTPEGDVMLMAGTMTDPATKHPYVDLNSVRWTNNDI